jgi:Tfp pilus assembly protein PilF
MRCSGARFGELLASAVVVSLVNWAGPASAQSGTRSFGAGEIRIIGLQGSVEIKPCGATTWVLTTTNQLLHASDRLRTLSSSRVWLLWSDRSIVNLGELTEIEILPPQDRDALSGLHMIKGFLSFFHRERPGRIRVITRGAVAGIEGTEFVLAVDSRNSQERTTLSVIDGRVRFSNDQGALTLTNSQQAVAEPGRAPARTAGFIVNNILQWCFYYPAVLDLEELRFSANEEQALSESLTAYRTGDLLQALAKYPPERQPVSDAEKVYYAALLLSVGQAEQAEAALAALESSGRSELIERLALALRTLIAAVKCQPNPSNMNPQLSTEFLAASYYEQSRAQGDISLRASLDLARQAVARSPQFGFAWERAAELEFGFGHVGAALEALNRGLRLAPRNAQALALKGFLLAAENKPRQATEWFDQAIAVDGALGNAWLGRGLCRIRVGQAAAGREDLLVAAALEPQRALLRSYLGKAFADAGDTTRATKELRLARQLDLADPTVWLYSALLKQQQNRVNEAIKDLETSQDLNDNRNLFRSRLLLDEDLAVSSANLASIYRDAGMNDVSVREASRAVTYDYANAAAHLFLSDSYNEQRDPTRFNLRYETVWFNELLLANLLSPIGGGRLSQHVSQQEYSQLFQADGLGIANSTLARSDNKSVTELASQFGTFGGTSYALDLDYQHNDGFRPNNELNSIEWYTTIKQQITPQDTLLALIKYEDYHSGDNFQYYDQTNARPYFQFEEYQQPIVVAGWHHEWSPSVHTLVLGGRLENEQYFSDRGAPQLLLFQDASGGFYDYDKQPFDINYHNQLEIYTAEVNQLLRWDRVTLSAGARYQSGTFSTQTILTNPPGLVPFFFANAFDTTNASANFERITGYGYLTVEPLEQVWLTGGLAYDELTYPLNYRYPPIAPGEADRSLLGPKAAAVWQPIPRATLRGAFSRSLGGVSLDESYRLEQTQLAGFPQAFRSLIPESVVGSVEAPEYQTIGAALDLKFPTGTYAGIQFGQLTSNVRRNVGLFSLNDNALFFVPNSTTETLDYRDTSIAVSVNQLLGKCFAFGASYKYDRAELQDSLPDVPVTAVPSARQNLSADLQLVTGYVLFNHPSGFFARADASWYHQVNSGYTPALPGDDFIQENLYVGYRFLRRHAELMFGILNVSGQDYHLNPLSSYTELPRERSYVVRLNFVF